MESANQWPVCKHGNSEIRYRLQSNGVRIYKRQCLQCGGQIGNAIKYADAPVDAALWDDALQDRSYALYRQRSLARFDQIRQERSEQYQLYLQSTDWAAKRELVLLRDNFTCKAVLPGCERTATQAHHLTYQHIFNEPLFDLVAVCRHCHRSLHDLED